MWDQVTSGIYIWLIPLLVLTMGLWTAGHALLNKRDPKAAFGWIAMCIILPIGGPILYLLFGINRVRIRAQRDYHTKISRESLQTIPDPEGTSFRPLSNVGEVLTRKGLSACSDLQVYENGETLYPAMLEAIGNARDRILLASYIFDNDATGLEIAHALAAAKARGVQVKVILDGMGELMSFPRIGGKLRKLGINFSRFNPLHLFPPSLNINMRNHRKLMIVDGLLAFTGGQNIGDRHLAGRLDNPHRVLDIHFALQGKIVDELEWAFWQDWYFCSKDRSVHHFRGTNINEPDSPIWSRLILDGPNKDLDKLSHLINGIVSAANHQILIMTPYFLPTFDLTGALIAARMRGLTVRILLPGHNNIKLAHWAAQSSIRQLLEADIDIRYLPSPFVHSKLLLIDDCYAMIGSANIDPRSLRLNYELGVELFSHDVNTRLSNYFNAMSQNAKPATIAQINNRSLPVKLRDALAWLFSPYL